MTALSTRGAEQSAPITGSADALRGLRTQFEQALHPLARATFRCLKSLGREEDAAKVALSPGDLHNARAVALAGIGESLLELAEPLSQPPVAGQPVPGEEFGVTAAKVAAVDALWERRKVEVRRTERRKRVPNQVPVRASRRWNQPGANGLAGTERLRGVLGDEAKSRSPSTEHPPTGKPDAGEPPVRFGGRGGAAMSALPTPIPFQLRRSG